jgi:D-xylose transport system substrate-binding protein
LLPDVTSSDRWETKDHPLLVQAIKSAIPNVQIDYDNAQDSSDTQLSQAQADLAKGDCILVVGAHDSVAAAAIVEKAKAQGVPVIAYDRLIQSKDTNYYVSFDGVAVGELQGQYIATHYQKYMMADSANVAIISGSQTDNNALLFSKGLHEALDPLFANGSLKSTYEKFTPDWSNPTAQTEMEVALNQAGNNIQIAYVANDGMASAVITALKTAKLNGKVLVTGQDATGAGIHNILTGDQNMTVYKPIAKLAQSVGSLIKLLHDGGDTNTLTKGATSSTFDGGNVPSVLDAPVAVYFSNIASTVIADNYVSKTEVCDGIAPGTAGVC